MASKQKTIDSRNLKKLTSILVEHREVEPPCVGAIQPPPLRPAKDQIADENISGTDHLETLEATLKEVNKRRK